MAKCSSCNADILWGVTDNGKRMPLSVRSLDPNRYSLVGDRIIGVGPTYLSHFADCPNAAKHRKDWKKTNGD
jgi:hypothetical protein